MFTRKKIEAIHKTSTDKIFSFSVTKTDTEKTYKDETKNYISELKSNKQKQTRIERFRKWWGMDKKKKV